MNGVLTNLCKHSGWGLDSKHTFDSIYDAAEEIADFLTNPVRNAKNTLPDTLDNCFTNPKKEVTNAEERSANPINERLEYGFHESTNSFEQRVVVFINSFSETVDECDGDLECPVNYLRNSVGQCLQELRDSIDCYLNNLTNVVPQRGQECEDEMERCVHNLRENGHHTIA